MKTGLKCTVKYRTEGVPCFCDLILNVTSRRLADTEICDSFLSMNWGKMVPIFLLFSGLEALWKDVSLLVFGGNCMFVNLAYV